MEQVFPPLPEPERPAETETARSRAQREFGPHLTGSARVWIWLGVCGLASTTAASYFSWGHKQAAQTVIAAAAFAGGVGLGLAVMFGALWVLAPRRQRDELREEIASLRGDLEEVRDYVHAEENPETIISWLTNHVNQAISERQAVELGWSKDAEIELVSRMLTWKLDVVTYLARVAPMFVADFQADARMTYGAEPNKERLLHEWEQRVGGLRGIIKELRARAYERKDQA